MNPNDNYPSSKSSGSDSDTHLGSGFSPGRPSCPQTVNFMEEIQIPVPIEGLHGTPIPPFLSKTFDLVDDPDVDPVISWGPKGESFVVWDPVEMARIILPRNFKHNNFSSFVRQLNTYGFRKIDTDRWEFANESFLRGKRNLLKNIHRRKSPQSQQNDNSIGSSSLEVRNPSVEGEIEQLRREKSLMMQEVIELQQQQRGTVQHMEVVNEKLKAAEQRQKQMVTFLAKVFQNPTYLARLQPMNQMTIMSPRTAKKFVKHQQHNLVMYDPLVEGEFMKYKANLENLAEPSGSSNLNQVAVEQIHCLPEDTTRDIGLGADDVPFQVEGIASDELAAAHCPFKSQDQATEEPSGLESRVFGKKVVFPNEEAGPEYFVSFPEDLAKGKDYHEILAPGFEKNERTEEAWNMGFEAGAGMSSSNTQLWGNYNNFSVPDFGVSSGLSDIWDFDSSRLGGVSGFGAWPADESQFDELESQNTKLKYDSCPKD